MKKIGLINDLSVMNICDKQYKKIEAIVYECENRFGV